MRSVPDPDKITVKQAAKLAYCSEAFMREWFETAGLRIWKRDKVLLSDVVLFQAEQASREAAFTEMVRLSEEMGLYDLD